MRNSFSKKIVYEQVMNDIRSVILLLTIINNTQICFVKYRNKLGGFLETSFM